MLAQYGSITNFMVGWGALFLEGHGWHWAALETKWRNAKKWFAHLPWSCLHMAQSRVPFRRFCPHPRHLWSNDQWPWIRTTWIIAALQKPAQISTLKSLKNRVGGPPKGCIWRYIKRNMACLDPSHFIEDMFMGIIIYIYVVNTVNGVKPTNITFGPLVPHDVPVALMATTAPPWSSKAAKAYWAAKSSCTWCSCSCTSKISWWGSYQG